MARAPAKLPDNFEAVLNRTEKSVRLKFEAAMRAIKDNANRAEIEQALLRRDTAAVLRALNIESAYFYDLDRAIDQAYYDGATREGQLIQREARNAFEVRFDGRHRRAETFVRETGAKLVQTFDNDVKAVIAQIVEQGIREGRGPRDVALDIIGRIPKGEKTRRGGVIGLTPQMARYVMNMRTELETADPNYFTRKARDRRGDNMVRQLMTAGRTPTASQINALIDKYADNLLQLRGETIARTESIKALNAGRYEMARQLVESDKVPRGAIKFIWDATLSKRTRDSHLHLNGEEVGFDEAFKSPITGALMRFPGDTAMGAPGAETINCRCTVRTRIDRRQLATKKPVGRPAGGTNKPKPLSQPPQPVPPPVAPPLAPPAPPVLERQPFEYPNPRSFETTKEVNDYIRKHKLADKIEWNSDLKDEFGRVKRRAQFVVRTHEVMERFGLKTIPVIGDIPPAELTKSNGTGAYVRSHWVDPYDTSKGQRYKELRMNPNITRGTHDTGVFESSTAFSLGVGKTEFEQRKNGRSVRKDADLASRYDRRNSVHWTISQEFRDTSYVHDVALHEGGHLVHFTDNQDEIDRIVKSFDWDLWALLLSAYAQTNHKEYVAEAFNLYMRGDESEYYRIHPKLLEWFKQNDRARNQ